MKALNDDRRRGRRRKLSDSLGGLRILDRRKWIVSDSDRRTLTRLPEGIPVLFSPEDEIFKEFRSSSVNLSARGLQIRSQKEFAIGSRLHLCLYPPDLFVPVQVDGQIAWRRYETNSKSYVYGLSFRDLTGEYQALLDDFISERIHKRGRIRINLKDNWNSFLYQRVIKRVLRRSMIGQRAVQGRSDSGFTFDHIYSNKPKGEGIIGRWVDKVLLGLPAARASRYRKDLISEALRHEIRSNNLSGQMTRVLDLGSGTARYLIEGIRDAATDQIEALCVDRDRESVWNGRCASHPSMRFIHMDIFKLRRLYALSARSGWRPNVIIISGLIYYFSDKKVKALLSQVFEWLEPGGLLIVTNMIQNPNKKLIGHLFIAQNGDPWIPLARPTHLVRHWLADAGFQEIHHTKDPWGMYSVFSARRGRGKMKSGSFEFRSEGSLLKGKLYRPPQIPKLQGVVLFLHGLGYSYSTYRLTQAAFCNEGLGLAMYNMAGHTTSTGEWSLDMSVSAVSRAIDTLMEQIQRDTSIFLFAHSTGALIGLLAAQRDQRVRGAALVSPVTSVTEAYLHWQKTGYNQQVKEFFKVDGIIPEMINTFLDDPEIMCQYQRHERSWSELEFPYRYGLMKAQSFTPLARAICFSPNLLNLSKEFRIPVILFTGARDDVSPVEKTIQLSERLKIHSKIVTTTSNDHFQSDQWGMIQKETINFFCEALRD